MSGPFEGLRVVEFGRFIAVPMCGQLLADGGADVIKVEALHGDQTRYNGPLIPGEGRQYINKNRGKRSIAVDLRNERVLEAVRTLATGADIVTANFRPGIAASLGLDYETLSRVNPRLIYAENTAFGTKGPMADAPGLDAVVQAYSGLAHFGELGPELLINPIIDYQAALLLAWGVSTALYQRERSGLGQKLDVALLQAALLLQNNHINEVDGIDTWRGEFVEHLKTAFVEGETWADVLEHRRLMVPHAFPRTYYGFFSAKDGMFAVAAGSKELQHRVVGALGIKDAWVTDDGMPDDAHAHFEATYEQVVAIYATEPAQHWIDLMRAAGVPVAPLQRHEELLDDEQAWANDFLLRQEHDLLGAITVVAPPVKFSQTPLQAESASPTLGRHTREVLVEAGLGESEVDTLRDTGAITEFDQ